MIRGGLAAWDYGSFRGMRGATTTLKLTGLGSVDGLGAAVSWGAGPGCGRRGKNDWFEGAGAHGRGGGGLVGAQQHGCFRGWF